MHVISRKRIPGQIEFGVIYGGITLFAIAATWFLPLLVLAPDCAFKGITGIPCPTCGTTHAVVYLSHGDIAAAFAVNPIATLFMIAAVVFFVYSLVTLMFDLPRLSIILTNNEKRIAKGGVVILVLAQWSYLIASR